MRDTFLCKLSVDANAWDFCSPRRRRNFKIDDKSQRSDATKCTQYFFFTLSQAEARAEFAERSVQKLQKEVDRLEGAYSTPVSIRIASHRSQFSFSRLLLSRTAIANLTWTLPQPGNDCSVVSLAF